MPRLQDESLRHGDDDRNAVARGPRELTSCAVDTQGGLEREVTLSNHGLAAANAAEKKSLFNFLIHYLLFLFRAQLL